MSFYLIGRGLARIRPNHGPRQILSPGALKKGDFIVMCYQSPRGIIYKTIVKITELRKEHVIGVQNWTGVGTGQKRHLNMSDYGLCPYDSGVYRSDQWMETVESEDRNPKHWVKSQDQHAGMITAISQLRQGDRFDVVDSINHERYSINMDSPILSINRKAVIVCTILTGPNQKNQEVINLANLSVVANSKGKYHIGLRLDLPQP